MGRACCKLPSTPPARCVAAFASEIFVYEINGIVKYRLQKIFFVAHYFDALRIAAAHSKTAFVMANKTRPVGRPRKVGPDAPAQVVAVRYSKGLLGRLDKWRKAQAAVPNRSDAVRLLTETALAAAAQEDQPGKPPSKKAVHRSSEMAAKEIDRVHDKAATPEQRASRKRRLLKGPKEFRDMRGDLPRPITRPSNEK